MKFDTLIFEQHSHFGIVRLNVPGQMNAMSPQMLSDLHSFFSTAPSPETQFVLIVGNGTCFGAGGDLKSMFTMNASDAEKVSILAHDAFGLIGLYPVPVVAVVHGYAIGGGFELALACDMIFATSDAWFSLPELKFKMLPGGGGTVRLPLAMGHRQAFWHLISGDKITAEKALHQGIVQQVVNPEEPVAESVAILEKITLRIEKETIKALKDVFSSVIQPQKEAFDKEAHHFSHLLDTYAKQKIKQFINKE
jgi:enoyl-CoA hydratase/carnithine racemase